jgi:hypothetical protein
MINGPLKDSDAVLGQVLRDATSKPVLSRLTASLASTSGTLARAPARSRSVTRGGGFRSGGDLEMTLRNVRPRAVCQTRQSLRMKLTRMRARLVFQQLIEEKVAAECK